MTVARFSQSRGYIAAAAFEKESSQYRDISHMHRVHFKLRVTALISARATYFAYAKRSLTSVLDIVINGHT